MINIRKILNKSSIRYLFVGGSVYLFELLVIAVAQHLGASPMIAVGLSFWLGFFVSFALQKLVAFSDSRMHRRIVASQLLAVGALVIVNFCFTLLVTKLLSNLVPAAVARTLALAVTTTWNYYLYKTRIFNRHVVNTMLID